jgi:CysZ protein
LVALRGWRSPVKVGTVASVTVSPTAAARRGGVVGDFFAGVGLMLRGLSLVLRSPRLWFLGLIPAVITFGLLGVGLFVLVKWDGQLATLITPFADHWASALRSTLRAIVEIALLGAWVLLSVLLYTALTLIIGQPFYEAIAKRIDDDMGGIKGERNVSFWRQLPRSIVESARLLFLTAMKGVLVFLVALIPVAGQIAGPILGAFVGGWAIALELTSVAFERRGLVLRHRRQLLGQRRALTLGFGVAAFTCLLIPGVDVLLMPGAVAGATLLSRRVFGDPIRRAP